MFVTLQYYTFRINIDIFDVNLLQMTHLKKYWCVHSTKRKVKNTTWYVLVQKPYVNVPALFQWLIESRD